MAEGASDVGLGDLTPGQTQPIPGVTGVTILGRVSDQTEYDRDSRVTFTVAGRRDLDAHPLRRRRPGHRDDRLRQATRSRRPTTPTAT